MQIGIQFEIWLGYIQDYLLGYVSDSQLVYFSNSTIDEISNYGTRLQFSSIVPMYFSVAFSEALLIKKTKKKNYRRHLLMYKNNLVHHGENISFVLYYYLL